jgi:hypothetical protein
MKATCCGVNMDVAQRRGSGVKILPNVQLRDYANAKYDGLPDNMRRVILHPYFQTAMQTGTGY